MATGYGQYGNTIRIRKKPKRESEGVGSDSIAYEQAAKQHSSSLEINNGQ